MTLNLNEMLHYTAGAKPSKAIDFADGFCYVAGISGFFVPNPVAAACYLYGGARLFNWL